MQYKRSSNLLTGACMLQPRKVALLSPNWTNWQYQFLSGALHYADDHPPILIRVFAPIPDLPEAVQAAEEWGAEAGLSLFEEADMEQFCARRTRPLPLVNCWLVKPRPGVVVVVGDATGFAQVAVDHLRRLGLRSLAFAVLEEGAELHSRVVQPFTRIARPANPDQAILEFPVDRRLLWNPDAAVTPIPARLAKWLRDLPRPVGVITPVQGGGGYLIRCCQALGLRVPQDVAVVGSDETDLSLACNPSLTSIRPSLDTLGYEAMRVLAEVMSGKAPPAGIVRLQCANLTVRGSTGLRAPEICDIAAALKSIRESATQGMTVQRLIRETQQVSKVTFHRHFFESVGKTPAEAIRDRKLEEVRRLLTNTELPLEMVAELSGFSTAGILARAFRSHEGVAPSLYRKRHQKVLSGAG
jgi:LacI family transcriptional regulator